MQLRMMHVGEAFRLPAVRHCEFAGVLGEFVTVYRRDGKPVPYMKMIHSTTNLHLFPWITLSYCTKIAFLYCNSSEI